MIVWLNGTFGAGKTTASKELVELLPGARIFDAEHVGYMLRGGVTGLPPGGAGGFQAWAPWRPLVVETATRLLDWLGGPLVVVQSVLWEPYWAEIRDGFAGHGVDVRHFVLHADREELERRISGDPDPHPQAWRMGHLDAYEAALPWLRREAEVLDTTGLDPQAVAKEVAVRLVGDRSSPRP